MALYKIDIVDGERGKITRKGWEERERVATVYRVVGTGYQKLTAAVVALQANPANKAVFGDQHPGVTENACYLEELNPEAITSADVRIRMVYRYPSFPEATNTENQIEVGATITQQTVNTNTDGDLMTVAYKSKQQPGSVSIPVPQATVRYQRRLDFSPGGLAKAYVGKTNSGGWAIDPGADEATWLCTRIVGTSDDDGATYLTTFEFAFKPDGYDETVVYIDPETGRMPDDIVSGDGIRTFEVIESADFNGIPY